MSAGDRADVLSTQRRSSRETTGVPARADPAEFSRQGFCTTPPQYLPRLWSDGLHTAARLHKKTPQNVHMMKDIK